MSVRGRGKSVSVSFSVGGLNHKQTFEYISVECTISLSDRWRAVGLKPWGSSSGYN